MFSRLRWQLPAALAVIVPVLLIGWTLVAVYAASPSPGASPGASPAASPGAGGAPAQALPGDPAKGQQLYNANGCASCHGANLGGGIGPKLNPIQKLNGVPNAKDPAHIETTVKNGRPGQPDGFSANMPAFPQLNDQDLADLAAFILQQNKQGPAGLDPVTLARSNVFWVSFGVGVLCLLTYLLARYNMRWIDRRALARRERERLS